MNAKFSPKTFASDKIVRNDRGKPLGRVVLPEDFEYETGIDEIPVLLLKIPKVISEAPTSESLYIDGHKYAIPKGIYSFRINLRGADWVIASFYLRRVPSEEA